MLLHIAAGALIALAPPQSTDTTFAVNPAHRLKVANFGGEVRIRTWERNEVRVEADHSRRERIVVERTATEVRIRPSSWSPDFEFDIEGDNVDVSMRFEGARVPAMVDYDIIVPVSMPIDVAGLFMDVTVEGPVGEANIRVLEGDIEVAGARGPVSARASEGDITIEDVQGALRLSAIDGEVEVRNASGEITAETTDGDITLEDIRATRVELESVDGDLWYSGTVQAQGFYSFITHDGSVTLEIPREVSARVSVATWDGDLTTDFTVQVPERLRGRRFEFTLGAGGAQIEIEAFEGDIEINYYEREE
jgi:hypothetical protein